jgi:hypothetical protein
MRRAIFFPLQKNLSPGNFSARAEIIDKCNSLYRSECNFLPHFLTIISIRILIAVPWMHLSAKNCMGADPWTHRCRPPHANVMIYAASKNKNKRELYTSVAGADINSVNGEIGVWRLRNKVL